MLKTGRRAGRQTAGRRGPPGGPTVRRWILAVLAVLAAPACAKIEPPPGGPPDLTPPSLIATRPESTAVIPGFKGSVDFEFDEVVSEGGSPSLGLGTSDLEKLIILSPTDQVPRISWKRSRITVEPREGWKPDRVYRVQLLPGIMDLRRNRMDSGAVITFSTGAPLPTAEISGQVVDWTTSQLGRGALVIATLLPDSLPYRTQADSSGRFDLGPIPAGEYIVYGVIDQNRNRLREARELFDSLRVRTDSAVTLATLWAFPHDTVGPRIQTITPLDSMAAEITFNQPLDPTQALDTGMVRLRLLPDSIDQPVLSFLPKLLDDSLQRIRRAALDSARAAADTARAAADTARPRPDSLLPRPPRRPAPAGRPAGKETTAAQDSAEAVLRQRPRLTTKAVLRAPRPFLTDTSYVIQVFGIRNLNGVAADAASGLRTPKPAPAADSTTAGDSTAARPDSAAAPPPVRPRR